MCATPCAGNGSACSANEQCCGNSCQNGVCVPPCTVNGEACAVSGQCCSANCQNGICVPACTSNGGECATSDECCSGICSAEGLCTEQCTIGPEFEGPYCNSSLPCCPGSGVCIFGACYQGEVCQMLGEACDNVNYTLWCCFEYNCVEGVCVPGCASAGESCSDGEFGPYCCGGLTCVDNVCVGS
jgi:hypothetical protein